MRLHQLLSGGARPAVAPLVGYPGAMLTGTSLRENLFDTSRHVESLRAIHKRWRPDVMFPMMDLAVEAGALGLPVRFPEEESPSVEHHPVSSSHDLEPLREADLLSDPRLCTFLDTVRSLAEFPDTLPGAYVVGPFTLAGLLMGASEVAVATIRQPKLVHELLAFATARIHQYAEACIEAGAKLIVYLEPTAVLISPQAFASFPGPYLTELLNTQRAHTVLHICGNTTPLLPEMCKTGVEGLSLDAAVDFAQAASLVPPSIVLIGNIDPVKTMGSRDPSIVAACVRNLQHAMSGQTNFLLSTGCDLPLETPLQNIDTFMEIGRSGN